MWRLESNLTEHKDSAYTTTYLEPHTDATYMVDCPQTQLFCCLERTGTGGESILVDGLAIAEYLKANEPEVYTILRHTNVPGRYLEPGVHLRANRPSIVTDADGALTHLSFNNYDRAPFRLSEPEMSRWYEAYMLLHSMVIDQSRWFQVRLEPGDALLFDNRRLLHGRVAYTGRRLFYGCYGA